MARSAIEDVKNKLEVLASANPETSERAPGTTPQAPAIPGRKRSRSGLGPAPVAGDHAIEGLACTGFLCEMHFPGGIFDEDEVVTRHVKCSQMGRDDGSASLMCARDQKQATESARNANRQHPEAVTDVSMHVVLQKMRSNSNK